MKPTDQQQLILDHEGNSVVIASPGSGKTFVLSHLIKKDLKDMLEHEGIVAISYTNKASNELKTRSLSNGEKQLSSFFGTIDRFNLSEIVIPFAKHIFGIPKEIKIIKHTSLSNKDQEDFNWFTRETTLNDISSEHIEVLGKYFNKGIILIETIGLFANYVITESLACQNYILSRYKTIYIDEYQDSGYAQHQIFLKIIEMGIRGVVVGDLNQSIYAFSGKDSRFLKELTERRDFKYFRLDKNHRCHPSIINYSNFLLNPKTELIETPEKNIFYKNIDGNEIAIAKFIDKNLDKILSHYKITKRSEVGVLTRSTRTAEIINQNLNTPHKYLISTELDQNLNIWSGIFSALFKHIYDPSYKFIDVVEIFTTYEKLKNNVIDKLQSEKRKLIDATKSIESNSESLLKIFISIAKLIAPTLENSESIELLKNTLKNETDIESYKPSSDEQVNILTLHKSKGLEYDLVLHLDLYEWVFPNKGPGPENNWNNPVFGNWIQDLNLHYVGITRARIACILLTSTHRTRDNGSTANGKPSEFLWHNEIEKLRYIPPKPSSASS